MRIVDHLTSQQKLPLLRENDSLDFMGDTLLLCIRFGVTLSEKSWNAAMSSYFSKISTSQSYKKSLSVSQLRTLSFLPKDFLLFFLSELFIAHKKCFEIFLDLNYFDLVNAADFDNLVSNFLDKFPSHISFIPDQRAFYTSRNLPAPLEAYRAQLEEKMEATDLIIHAFKNPRTGLIREYLRRKPQDKIHFCLENLKENFGESRWDYFSDNPTLGINNEVYSSFREFVRSLESEFPAVQFSVE
jgi:hypothetical protein